MSKKIIPVYSLRRNGSNLLVSLLHYHKNCFCLSEEYPYPPVKLKGTRTNKLLWFFIGKELVNSENLDQWSEHVYDNHMGQFKEHSIQNKKLQEVDTFFFNKVSTYSYDMICKMGVAKMWEQNLFIVSQVLFCSPDKDNLNLDQLRDKETELLKPILEKRKSLEMKVSTYCRYLAKQNGGIVLFRNPINYFNSCMNNFLETIKERPYEKSLLEDFKDMLILEYVLFTIECFNIENTLVIQLEKLVDDPLEVLNTICSFLKIKNENLQSVEEFFKVGCNGGELIRENDVLLCKDCNKNIIGPGKYKPMEPISQERCSNPKNVNIDVEECVEKFNACFNVFGRNDLWEMLKKLYKIKG